MRDEARRKYQKEQQLKKLEEKNSSLQLPADKDSDEDEDEDKDGGEVDEAKVDESQQMDFAKVEKRVRTTGGGSTGTVRSVISVPILQSTSGCLRFVRKETLEFLHEEGILTIFGT
jgi:hypothetical protein